jgi:hypothetical protein
MKKYVYTAKLGRFTTLKKYEEASPEEIRQFIVDQQNENPEQRLSVEVFVFDSARHSSNVCRNKRKGWCPMCFVETNTIVMKTTKNFKFGGYTNEETP